LGAGAFVWHGNLRRRWQREPVSVQRHSAALTHRAVCGQRRIQEKDAMNWDQIEGKWKQFRGQAKEQWGKLTDDDLDTMAGKRDQMVGKVQEKYGIAKEEAERQVDEWSRRG
jgi:uncharacterized protein YjbJ (UPF0337 family)